MTETGILLAIQRYRTKRARGATRAERKLETHERLLIAGEKIVGREGYAGASVSKIAGHAGVAQGTFYNYFSARQDLFDVLLPHVGRRMLEYITDRLDDDLTGAERESARFRAFCEYLVENPGFYRILSEAEVHAPKAYRRHTDLLVDGFRKALERSVKRGEITEYSDAELEAVVFMFLGARAYVAMRYIRRGKKKTSSADCENAIAAYTRLVADGLFSKAL